MYIVLLNAHNIPVRWPQFLLGLRRDLPPSTQLVRGTAKV